MKLLATAALLLVSSLALAHEPRVARTPKRIARTQTAAYAVGTVYHDKNKNGRRDKGEIGLRGIRVSNQEQIVRTDANGRYRLPVDDDTVIFVIKPRGWMTRLSSENLPLFYYVHKPNGSPRLRFPGVSATGQLPKTIDFPLHPQSEPDRFQVIVWADPQPRDQKEIDYISHDVIEELIGNPRNAAFGVTLGDIMFDDLSLFGSLNRAVALIGIPWYNVIGNHDINRDSPDDLHSDETFERIYGPSYYSFDYGTAHFIALDDVTWVGATPDRSGYYKAGLGEAQMEFIRNDLALTPRNQLVVLMMHIPLVEAEDRLELFKLIQDRPYAISISGHTHFQQHRFLTTADGWSGPEPHHHIINVTVSGSWWSGAPDENGIPNTMMRDGAPNGYAIMTFDGHKYTWEFKAARRPWEYQMNVFAPEVVDSAETGNTRVIVNVFGGSPKSIVQMRVGESNAWTKLEFLNQVDPYYKAMKDLEASTTPPPGRRLPGQMNSPHLWSGTLPANLPPGTHKVEIRTVDMFGRTYYGERVVRVR